ncbi:hypothetical protein GCM10009105_32250 [Dokdonella soli]|uniref:Uncharacterized protein n=2 Tax=Dokdonella soli TaxID=529810 RepID=A0ABN1IUM7_9GAMM
MPRSADDGHVIGDRRKPRPGQYERTSVAALLDPALLDRSRTANIQFPGAPKAEPLPHGAERHTSARAAFLKQEYDKFQSKFVGIVVKHDQKPPFDPAARSREIECRLVDDQAQ